MTAQTILPANTLSGGYNVANSLRFNDGSSDFLSKTFSSAGNQQKMTISFWIKRSDLSGTKEVISQGSGSACHINFQASGTLEMNLRNSVDGGSNVFLITNRLFRDVSAWYHIVLALDTTQGTASNRAKLYVNGVQETSFGTENYPSQNGNLFFNENSAMQIGEDTGGSNYNYDGYMAEFVFINAEQLAPTSFGEFDEDSPTIWKPIDVSDLTFGTNGFYLEFKQSGTSQNSSGLGADTSGQDNHFAVNNLTAGDQSTDTCTNNFCTLSPLYNVDGSYTLSEGNTQFLGTGGNDHTLGTLGVQGSGKWYFEAEFDTRSQGAYSGFADSDLANNLASDAAGVTVFIGMYRDDHTMQIGGGNEGAYTDVSDGDIFGFAMNLDANSGSRTVIVQKNGSTIDTVTIPTANEDKIFLPIVGDTSASDGKLKMNFGGTPNPTPSSAVSDANGFGAFEYSPTIGGVAYLALCTKNLGSNG